MSWSEIKKAVNSNLDLPLNEKLERMFLYDNFVAKRLEITHNDLAWSTLIDISGKGELQYIDFNGGLDIEEKLTVDGKEYLFSNSYESRLTMCSQKYASFCGVTTTGGVPTVLTANSSSLKNAGIISFSSIEWSSDSVIIPDLGVCISFKDELKFKQKLKVEVRAKKAGFRVRYGIAYELYD